MPKAHKDCLKRAKARRRRGFVNRKHEEQYRLEAAWLVTWERHERGELKL